MSYMKWRRFVFESLLVPDAFQSSTLSHMSFSHSSTEERKKSTNLSSDWGEQTADAFKFHSQLWD